MSTAAMPASRPRRIIGSITHPQTPPPRRLRGVAPFPDEGDMPDPELSFVTVLAVFAVEISEGSRPVAQLGNWITEGVADELRTRYAASIERRTLYRDTRRTVPKPGSVVTSKPAPNVFDAAVVMHLNARTIAVALRLEYLRQRWRATSLTVL